MESNSFKFPEIMSPNTVLTRYPTRLNHPSLPHLLLITNNVTYNCSFSIPALKIYSTSHGSTISLEELISCFFGILPLHSGFLVSFLFLLPSPFVLSMTKITKYINMQLHIKCNRTPITKEEV